MKNHRISFKKTLSIGVIAILVFIFLGGVRQLRYEDKSYSGRITSVFNNFKLNPNSVAEGNLYELAKSARCLPYSIDYKNHNSVQPGHFQTMYVLSTIPFLSNVYLKASGLDPNVYASSSSLISNHIQNGDVKYGNGTTIIADLFLDFGSLTTIIIMGFFGFFIKKTESYFYSNREINMLGLIYIIYFSVCIYLPRSAILMQLEKIAFIVLLLIFLSVFQKKKKKEKTAKEKNNLFCHKKVEKQ